MIHTDEGIGVRFPEWCSVSMSGENKMCKSAGLATVKGKIFVLISITR